MVQAREQELAADLKDEHLTAMTQWQEAAERADAKQAGRDAQVRCLNLLVSAAGYTEQMLAVSLILQHLMGSQHVIPQGKYNSGDKSTGS